MNAALLKIVIALYSFIVANPSIPQDVKDQALQVIGENSAVIQSQQPVCAPAAQTADQPAQTVSASQASNPSVVQGVNNQTTMKEQVTGMIVSNSNANNKGKKLILKGNGFTSSATVEIKKEGSNDVIQTITPSSVTDSTITAYIPDELKGGRYTFLVSDNGSVINSGANDNNVFELIQE